MIHVQCVSHQSSCLIVTKASFSRSQLCSCLQKCELISTFGTDCLMQSILVFMGSRFTPIRKLTAKHTASYRLHEWISTVPPSWMLCSIYRLVIRKNFFMSSSVLLWMSILQYLKNLFRFVYYFEVMFSTWVMPDYIILRVLHPEAKLHTQSCFVMGKTSQASNRQLLSQPQNFIWGNRLHRILSQLPSYSLRTSWGILLSELYFLEPFCCYFLDWSSASARRRSWRFMTSYRSAASQLMSLLEGFRILKPLFEEVTVLIYYISYMIHIRVYFQSHRFQTLFEFLIIDVIFVLGVQDIFSIQTELKKEVNGCKLYLFGFHKMGRPLSIRQLNQFLLYILTMTDISTSAQELLQKLQIQNNRLKRQLSEMQHLVCQLKIRANEQASMSVDYKVAWESLQIREKFLSNELQRMYKIYGTKKLELRCEKQQQRLLKNNFNFETLMGKQYNRTVEHYPDEHDDSEAEDEEEVDRPEERKETYYKQLLEELRVELAEKSRKLNETEETLLSQSMEISSLKLFSRKAANSFNAEISLLKETLAKNENEIKKTVTNSTKKEKKLEKEKNDLVEKIKKEAKEEVSKARTQITILKKQIEHKQGTATMIKEQYEKAQEIFQSKMKDTEERANELLSKHNKQIKDKDREIAMLKGTIERLCSEIKASQKQRDSPDNKHHRSSVQSKENLKQLNNKMPQDKFSPYRNKKKENSPGKIRKTVHSSSKKRKDSDCSETESIDVHTIKDLKKQIKKLQKMIDSAEA